MLDVKQTESHKLKRLSQDRIEFGKMIWKFLIDKSKNYKQENKLLIKICNKQKHIHLDITNRRKE